MYAFLSPMSSDFGTLATRVPAAVSGAARGATPCRDRRQEAARRAPSATSTAAHRSPAAVSIAPRLVASAVRIAARRSRSARMPSKPAPLTVHDLNGNKLAITTSVGGPATPSSRFDRPSAGKRLQAVYLEFHDLGPGQVSDDANNDTTIVGPDEQVYTPSFDGVQGCANVAYGRFTLFDGQSESGCVAFELPDGVSIKRIAVTLGVDTAESTAR
jgi:hypothetical protein